MLRKRDKKKKHKKDRKEVVEAIESIESASEDEVAPRKPSVDEESKTPVIELDQAPKVDDQGKNDSKQSSYLTLTRVLFVHKIQRDAPQ